MNGLWYYGAYNCSVLPYQSTSFYSGTQYAVPVACPGCNGCVPLTDGVRRLNGGVTPQGLPFFVTDLPALHNVIDPTSYSIAQDAGTRQLLWHSTVTIEGPSGVIPVYLMLWALFPSAPDPKSEYCSVAPIILPIGQQSTGPVNASLVKATPVQGKYVTIDVPTGPSVQTYHVFLK